MSLIVWGVFIDYVLLAVFCRVLARGSRLLCLWTCDHGAAAATGSAASRRRLPTERIILQVGAADSICSASISICHGCSIVITIHSTRVYFQSSTYSSRQ